MNKYINDNNIYIGFDLIDKVSVKSSETIIKEREEHGDFVSFDDFCARVPARQVNKRIKENLIWAGAFDELPIITDKTNEQITLDEVL